MTIEDEFTYACDGNCDSCDDDQCPEHPAQACNYYPEDMCPYSGLGSFCQGDFYCTSICGARKICEEASFEILEREG